MFRRFAGKSAIPAVISGAFALAASLTLLATPLLGFAAYTPYVDTSTGSGAVAVSGSSGTTASGAAIVRPGGTIAVTFRLADLPAGTVVTFASSTSNACTGSFSSATGVVDAAGRVTVNVSFPSTCAGDTLALTATGPQGQRVSFSVFAGGYPNTGGNGVPVGAGFNLGLLLGLLGLLLVGGGFGGLVLARRNR